MKIRTDVISDSCVQEVKALATFHKVLTHPIRIMVLAVIMKAESEGLTKGLSPNELSKILMVPFHAGTRRLSGDNYHVTDLVEAGLLELAGERPARGAMEHFYRVPEAMKRRLFGEVGGFKALYDQLKPVKVVEEDSEEAEVVEIVDEAQSERPGFPLAAVA